MSEKILDTYFFDSQLALEVALRKNQAETSNPNITGLQLCYYNGEKLKKSPKNCIHLPLDEIYSYFITTNHRFPKFVCFLNTEFSKDEQISFNNNLSNILTLSISQNNLLVEKYKKKIKKNKPNFSDKKLRVFIAACRETIVMQHISKNISQSFKKIGCEVKFHIQKNDMESCGALAGLKELYKFNPHITVNINHFNNDYLNKHIYNFVWFQDYMDIFKDSKQIKLRKKDYIFTLFKDMQEILKSKGVKKIQMGRQNFCINTNIYKLRKKIKKKNKVVFIGSSYKKNFDNVPISKEKKSIILNELLDIYLTIGPPSEKIKEEFCIKYELDSSYNLGHIINYIERDMTIKNIIKLNPTLDFELYGYGWDTDKTLQRYNKGVLNQGKDISKVYNKSKFALVSGGYILQQRTLEAAASGSIPVVLDVRHNSSSYDKSFESAMLFFNTPKDLTELLKTNRDFNFNELVKSHSYSNLIKKIISIVEEKINEK